MPCSYRPRHMPVSYDAATPIIAGFLLDLHFKHRSSPTMSAGATDGSYLRNAGIPTYGHSGLTGDVDDVRVHGKDERVLVKSFFDGQEYLYRLVKMLSGG